MYPLLVLLFFIPSYASKSYDPRQSADLIGQVLSAPLIYTFPALLPVAKIVPVILIAGLFIYGNKLRRPFNIYAAVLYLALALFQATAFTDTYGLVIVSGNLAIVLVVALVWVREAAMERNDFSSRKHPLWRWWVAPLALFSFLAPVNASLAPDFGPLRLLANEAGLTFCMMTPVILALLTLFYPSINLPVLRITSFAGILLGLVNMVMWFAMAPGAWWMGVLHIPLVVISIYAFVLGHVKTLLEVPGAVQAQAG